MSKSKDRRADELRYTASGIPIKAYYGPGDTKSLKSENLTPPGQYPFTRGIHPHGYRYFPWQNAMISGYGLPEEANERQKYLRDKGVAGYEGAASINFAFDNPTQNGFDADNPLSRYEVGTGGIFVNSLQDIKILLDDFDPANLNVAYIIDTPGPIIFAMYIAYADRMGIDRSKLRGIITNSPWRRYYTGVALPFPTEHAMRVTTDCIKFAAKEVPNFNTYSVNCYDTREAGASAIQEMAFSIAPAIEVAKSLINQGIKVDDFISNFNFFLSFQNDFFEEIAKIRAARRVWAKVVKEKLGAKEDKSCWMKAHLQTGGCTLTAQEPHNNIARVAIQVLGAALAGVQSMSSDSYDEAICLPTEDSVRVAVKTQKIVEHEIGITNIVDPLGGSYYLEHLTEEIEKEIWNYLNKIDSKGGFLKCINSGFIENEVANTAFQFHKEVKSGEKVVVGVNKYVENETVKYDPFEYNPEIRNIQIERLRKLKAQRDNDKVKKYLAELKEAATNGGDLMPIYIKAAKADATMGEMMQVLRDVFGYYQPKNIIGTTG